SHVYFGETYNSPLDHRRYLRLAKYIYDEEQDILANPEILLEGIPVFDGYHVGGKLAVSPEGQLYLSIGDAKQPENPELHRYMSEDDLPLPQDLDSFSGKILRINADGTVPVDNPFAAAPWDLSPRNLTYSYGHRNTQGLTFSDDGQLYYSEHGGRVEDEVGMVEKGSNHGWPYAEGKCNNQDYLFDETVFCDTATHTEPFHSWNPDIAPSSLAYLKEDVNGFISNALIVPSLTSEDHGLDLRVLMLNQTGNAVIQELTLADKVFGRLRDVAVSPIGQIYFTTSNRMWGNPSADDDRIIRMDIEKLESVLSVRHTRETPYAILGNGTHEVVVDIVASGNCSLIIHDLKGALVFEKGLALGKLPIHLPNGTYVLRLNVDDQIYLDKLIITDR
ncbi:MAG: PQQ-dependent sugar dehydrogenase, partial [Bacteroidota bacterium]